MHESPDSREAKRDMANMMEQSIVTSTGSFLITWNFRRVKLDYDKLNKHHEARVHICRSLCVCLKRTQIETTVQPQFAKLENDIVATQFEYWDTPTSGSSHLISLLSFLDDP